MLDRRGLYQRLIGDSEIPQPAPTFFFGALPLDLAALDDNPFYLLPVPQPRIQQVLEERAAELGVEVRRGHELTGLSQRADEVIVDVNCPEGRYEMRCRYVAGADGGHSTTRRLAGIGFPGATNDEVVARTVEIAVPADLVDTTTGGLNVPGYGHIPPFAYQRTDTGVFAFGNLPARLHCFSPLSGLPTASTKRCRTRSANSARASVECWASICPCSRPHSGSPGRSVSTPVWPTVSPMTACSWWAMPPTFSSSSVGRD